MEGLNVYIVYTLLSLPTLAVAVYILAKVFVKRANPDPNRAAITKVNLDLQRSKAGMDEYERQRILDMLGDQLKYSQEDYSELQGEMKALRIQVAKLENGIVAVGNRLDNYRLLLSQILEAVTRK